MSENRDVVSQLHALHVDDDATEDEFMERVEVAVTECHKLGVQVLGIADRSMSGNVTPDDADTIQRYIDAAHKRYVELGVHFKDFAVYMQYVQLNYGLDDMQPEDTDTEEIIRRMGALTGPIIAAADVVYNHFADNAELMAEVDNKLSRAMAVVNSMKDMLAHTRATRLRTTCALTDLNNFKSSFDIVKLLNSCDDGDNEADVVRFAVHTLQQLQIRQYRRYGDRCYRQRVITRVLQDGHLVPYDEEVHTLHERRIIHTRSWEDVCSIDEFVRQEASDKLISPEMWKIGLQRPNIHTTIRKDLVEGRHHEFQELHINQCMFAFSNGIYHTEKQKFYPWFDVAGCSASEQLTRDGVPINDTCINYFEVDCTTSRQGYMHIPTPSLDRIVRFQLLQLLPGYTDTMTEDDIPAEARPQFDADCEEVMSWIYAHMGRLMFPLHKHDNWQIALYIMGMAGTGKSTLAMLFYKIFPKEHIALVSDNVERQFGLQTLYDKALWLSPEVKESFQLNLSELQCMISGEYVQVAIKNGTPRMVKWKAPGMMCGNLVPPWNDKAGAMHRRFVLVHFDRLVPADQIDGSLERLLYSELGGIIPKLSQAYLHRAHQIGDKDMWSAMPPIFHKWRTVFQKQVDPVMKFVLEGGCVSVDPRGYVLEDLFVQELREHVQRTDSARRITWAQDTYQHFFSTNRITIVVALAAWEGAPKKARYIVGVKHADHDTDIDNLTQTTM